MPIDLGIDLGTANTLIYEKNKVIVLNEPSMVVRSKKTGQIIAIGEEAADMMGRTPDDVQAIRPIRNGVITSFQGTVALLKSFFKKVAKGSMQRIRVVICVPCCITEVERRAVTEAAHLAGAKNVYLIEQPLAAAIGSGIEVSEPHGSMVVNVGAGVTEVAVISLGGIVVSHSVRSAGEAFDNAIIQYIKKKYNMSIGDVTAQQIKCDVGSAYFYKETEKTEVKGRDLMTGMPKTIFISSDEIREPIKEVAEVIVDTVKATLENTPPELASDIMESGIVLSGGGAMLKGLGRLINVSTDIPVYISEAPMECVATGAGKSLDFMVKMNRQG